jgi:hypothetical protein
MANNPRRSQMSTGDPEDDQLLRHIAARARLNRPREVKHYLYVPPGAEYDGWEVSISTDEQLTPGP